MSVSEGQDRPVMLITGTSRGIGRALAEHYLSRGFRLFGCARSEAGLDHPLYTHFPVDVGSEKEVIELFGALKRESNRLDVLVNNAGVASMNHSLLTPAASVSRVLHTNVLGTFLFCREAAKLMKKRGGRIVNFSSVAVPLALEGEAVYAASKAAVETLTRVLARELSEYRITVNALGPTPIRTDLIGAVPESKIQALLERQAIPRLGTFSDVVNVVDFLIRPESDFITGQVLYLGGV